jgi:hypothetical protein
MTQSTKVSFVARLLERLNLRFPTLFLVLAILTLIDFVIPDPIPFLDEIVLALLTVLFAMWKNRKATNNGRGAP